MSLSMEFGEHLLEHANLPEPENIVLKVPVPYQARHDWFRYGYESAVTRAWRDLTSYEPHRLLKAESYVIEYRCSRPDCTPDNVCAVCQDVEKKGNRLRKRWLLTMSHTAEPAELVSTPLKAPRHRASKGSASYHKRVQKKWDTQARGKMGVEFKQHVFILNVSDFQAHILRKSCPETFNDTYMDQQ